MRQSMNEIAIEGLQAEFKEFCKEKFGYTFNLKDVSQDTVKVPVCNFEPWPFSKDQEFAEDEAEVMRKRERLCADIW